MNNNRENSQESSFNQPVHINRRGFLQQGSLLALGLSLGFHSKLEAQWQSPPALKFEESFEAVADSVDKEKIREAYNVYVSRYKPQFPREIAIHVRDLSGETIRHADQSLTHTLEIASSGKIEYGISLFDSSQERNKRLKNLRDTTLHALTHAFVPENTTPFKEKILLPDKVQALGVIGFSVDVRLPDGKDSKFRVIEEGICEALAWYADNTYQISTEDYSRLGSLSIQLIKKRNIAFEEVAKMVQVNDLWKFISLLTKTKQPGEKELRTIMTLYQKVRNGEISIEEALKE